MDFLSIDGATIGCKAKVVSFQPPGEEQFTFSGDKNSSQDVVSAMKAREWLASGCTGYLAAIVDTTKKGKGELSNVPVVNEFTSVLPRRICKFALIEELLSRSKCTRNCSNLEGALSYGPSRIERATDSASGIA